MGLGKPNIEKMKEKNDIAGLIKALSNEKTEVREASVKALGEVGGNMAVEPLIAALKDNTIDVRLAAVAALGLIGDKRAIVPLKELFDEVIKEADRNMMLTRISNPIRDGDFNRVAHNAMIAALRDETKYALAALEEE